MIEIKLEEWAVLEMQGGNFLPREEDVHVNSPPIYERSIKCRNDWMN